MFYSSVSQYLYSEAYVEKARASELVQQMRALAAKNSYLSSVPRTHLVEDKNQLLQVGL